MTPQLPSIEPGGDGPGTGTRYAGTVLMLDVVESVRLMESDEHDAVRRWRELVERVKGEVLPAHACAFVRSRGDGLLMVFPRVNAAVQVGLAVQRLCHRLNADASPSRRMEVRIGAHCGSMVMDGFDVYGHDVNLAARVATLAGPGEFVVTAEVSEQIIPTLDADVEDLGECRLKHVAQPLRAYRVGPAGPRPVIEPGSVAMPELRPTIAVIAPMAYGSAPDHDVLGEVLADELIAAFSRTAALQVISRLSTNAFRGRSTDLADVRAHLHAGYVLSGRFRTSGDTVTLNVELADATTGHVPWAKSLRASLAGIVAGQEEVIDRVVAEVGTAVIANELARAQSHPLPNLESYTLLMSGIALTHRLSEGSFKDARRMLDALIERAPRHPLPHAWLAKWHVMRVQQGWAQDAREEGRLALDCTRRALDSDPDCALALTIDGLVHTNLLKRFDVARGRYEAALRVNPNESLAWLLKGTMHAFAGEGEEAIEGTERALALSPLDPLRSYFDSLAATAALSARKYERAIELARRSLRSNRMHTSTLRVLTIAQVQLGEVDAARVTATELMRLEPSLTVADYLARTPSSGYETGRIWSESLRIAGVPER